MNQLTGRRVLVTGASGLVALPVAVELAKSNEVFAVARFSDPEQKRLLEAAGAHPIAFDLANPDLSPLPRSVDVVINYAVLPPSNKEHYNVNAGATGRLARRYRDCEAFVQGSTGSLYAYQGERALREEDPYGLHSSAEPYAASKIAAEFLLKHLSEDYRLPTVIIRIFSFYGPRGGGVTQRLDQVARGDPVSVYPGVRNVHTPLFEDDYVAKTIAAVGIARSPAEIINVGGTEAVTTQEYCEMAGELVGRKPSFVENSKAWPIWADTTRMVKLLGPNKVSVREGVRRSLEAAQQQRVSKHHVIGEPAEAARDHMITFIAQVRVGPGNVLAFERMMTHVVAMTHAHEPGVAWYEFARSVDDPDTYVVVEVYRDVAAQAAHMQTAWVRESLPVSAGLIEGKPHIRQYVSPGSEPVRQRMFPEV